MAQASPDFTLRADEDRAIRRNPPGAASGRMQSVFGAIQ